MEFKVSLDFGRKKSNPIISTTATVPEVFGDGYFYPLELTTQNDKALIAMYNDLPEVQAPINYIIDSLTTVPYAHYKNGKEVENSDIINLLNTPNQYHTENDFIKTFFLNRIVLGIGYINTVKAVGLGVSKLFVLPSQAVNPKFSKSKDSDFRFNDILNYEFEVGGHVKEIDKDNLFIQREATLDLQYYRIVRSRLLSAINTSDSLRLNYEAKIKMLADRGAVGIISPKHQNESISADDAKRMRQKFYSNNGIVGQKDPYLISPRSIEFAGTSMNAGELKLNENKLQDFQMICSVLGVDSSLFENSRATYNNKILAKKNFYEDVIVPYFNNYLQLLGNVFDLPENEELKADYSNIPALQDDYKTKVDANSTAYNDNVISEEEYRENIGFKGLNPNPKKNEN